MLLVRPLRRVDFLEFQRLFVELWRRAGQFDGRKGGAVAWVITIARSRAIDRLRAAGTAGRAIEGAETAVDPVATRDAAVNDLGPAISAGRRGH